MMIRPVHNILLLPEVAYYFKKEFFSDWGGQNIQSCS